MCPSKQRVAHPMLFYCWASVGDNGPTLKQQRVDCILDITVISYCPHVVNKETRKHKSCISIFKA